MGRVLVLYLLPNFFENQRFILRFIIIVLYMRDRNFQDRLNVYI